MARAKRKTKAPTSREVIEKVGQDVIDLLENGVSAEDFSGVVKNPALSVPRNAITQRPYRGMNAMLAMLAMLHRGTRDGRFCTVAQARTHADDPKLTPAKGTKATRLMRPVKLSDQHEEDDGREINPPLERDNDDSKVIFRPFPVFHVSDMPDFTPPELDPQHEITSHELVRHFVAAAGAEVTQGASPAFIPNATRKDGGVISMPLAGDYPSADDWAADCLHEFYHWTGAAHRQGRYPANFGSGTAEDVAAFHANYATEEVRADFFAAIAGRMLNLSYDIREHAAYLAHWSGKAATGDSDTPTTQASVIRSTINDVAPVVTALQAFMTHQEPELEWFPPYEEWPAETQAYFDSLAPDAAPSEPTPERESSPESTTAEDAPAVPPALAASPTSETGETPSGQPAALADIGHEPRQVGRLPKNNAMSTKRRPNTWQSINTVRSPGMA